MLERKRFEVAGCLMGTFVVLICLFLASVRPISAIADETGRSNHNVGIWIFVGLTGDQSRFETYQAYVSDLTETFQARHGLSSEQIHVLFDEGGSSYSACTKENLLTQLEAINQHCSRGGAAWVFFFGHGSSYEDKLHFNIAGPDISARQIAETLKQSADTGRKAMFFPISAGGKFLKVNSARNHCIIVPFDGIEEDDEPEMPAMLVETFCSNQTDLNHDEIISMDEIFMEASRRVNEYYRANDFLQFERLRLDGDGNGRGTMKPADSDARGARKYKLFLIKQ